ncbi:MAG: radical SAM protein [Desulfobacteraceae bacterium]|nr:radical SAM protein [Desulfobacteraceae bacterium]
MNFVAAKPFIVPVFIPHAGCPHRCVFCDQTATTGCSGKVPTNDKIHEIITQFLSYRSQDRTVPEISFYGGTFLGLNPDLITRLLRIATEFVDNNHAGGIRFSTRPDSITPENLALIENFPVTTVELGVQSMNNNVLKLSRRGQTAEDTSNAVNLLKTSGIPRLGLQMMIGLPGDTSESVLQTGQLLADMAPDFVRVYPTLVLKGSALARWYQQGRYEPPTLSEAVELAQFVLELFIRRRITVARLGLQATQDLNQSAQVLAGPFHPAFGELVYAALWRKRLKSALRRMGAIAGTLSISIHPRIRSQVAGHKNQNLEYLKATFNIKDITITHDDEQSLDCVLVNEKICYLV